MAQSSSGPSEGQSSSSHSSTPSHISVSASSTPNPNPNPRPSVLPTLTAPSTSTPKSKSASTCVEYERLVGKIMRDNFWDLDPFTVGLNPGLLNFDKPFIRSKAPHIKSKARLLERILRRMVDDEHLLLVCTNPNMYRPHPDRSTIDYLVIGDDPPWIPHFFNGSLAYPHVEEAMNSISGFLDSEGGSKPPSRVPTVGISRASSFAISRFKAEDLPSVEEYIDFVHAVVQSGSSPNSSSTIREDQFFPSMAVMPVAEVRKRANLVMRLMGRMVEDAVLVRVSAQDGTYALHPNCRPADYMADRGLTDISHWVWTFKTWAVLDPVAEKAVTNLEMFLNDLSPTERSRIKIERGESPPSKIDSKSATDQDEDVYIVKQEDAAPSSVKARTPRQKPKRQKHKRTDRDVSSSSSGSDQSSIVEILTLPKSLPPRRSPSPPQLDPEDSLMDSIEIPDENSPAAIQLREKMAFADYFQAVPEHRRTLFPIRASSQFVQFHASYPNDSFEVIVERTVGSYRFHIICHDCDGRRIATKYEDSVSKLTLHLNAVMHVTNVMSKLEGTGEIEIETLQTKKRLEVLKRVADQSVYDQKKQAIFVSESLAKERTANNNTRGSPSAGEVEALQAMYELPQKAFGYRPPQARKKTALVDQSNDSSRVSTPLVQTDPSRLPPTTSTPSQAALEAFRSETNLRLEALVASDKRTTAKLDNYGVLLHQTHNRYGELEKEVSAALKSSKGQRAADMKSLVNAVKTSFEPLIKVIDVSQQVPNEMVDKVDALLYRDEQHEIRWEEQEKARVNFSEAIETLSQNQKSLGDRLGKLKSRDTSLDAGVYLANIDERIEQLESAKIQFLETQNDFEQEHRVMNARFGLLEHHDQSLDEAANLINGISSRIEELETARSQALTAVEALTKDQQVLIDRFAAFEQEKSASMNPGSTTPVNGSAEVPSQKHQDAIKQLTKNNKKFSEWVNYFSQVTTAQKTTITSLETKLANEVTARNTFEGRVQECMEIALGEIKEREDQMEVRMEKLLKAGKEREDKMAGRIEALERKERIATQLAFTKASATPRSVPGSDNERGSKSSSNVGGNRSIYAGTGTGTTRILPGATPTRPPASTGTSSTRILPGSSPNIPPRSTGTGPTRILPGASTSRASSSMAGSTKNGDAPRGSQIGIGHKKPRKF